MILIKILEQSANQFSEQPALTMKMGFRTLTLSYKDVYEISKKVSIFLKQNGIKKGDKVLICAPNSPYWICVFWGTLLAGAVIVPLNIQTTKKVIDKIAEQTESKIIFKHIFFKHELDPQIKQFEIEFLKELLVGIDANEFTPTTIDENDLFQIMYTSGTTGDPKGVMLSHKNIYSNLMSISEVILVDFSKDKLLSILPLSHIFEQNAGFLLAYLKGVHIIYAHSYAAIRQLLKKYKITKVILVPEFLQILMSRIQSEVESKGKLALFNKLLKLSQKLNNRFISRILFYPILKNFGGKLNMFASGGAALDPDLEQQWEYMGVDVLQGYGLTETSPVISTNTFHEKRIGSVGKVIPGVEVKIAQDGEILVKGPNVFAGYFKNTQKTEESFTQDGWFKTGDLGEFDKDNFLFIKGRKKYMIKSSGGQNVYPEDIELELNRVPGVVDSCVLGIEKPNGAVEIHAVILLDQTQPDAQKIVDQANEHLSSYQHITAYTVWPDIDFPRTVTRKIKKEEVRKFVEQKRDESSHQIYDEKKSRLIQILSQVTGVEANKINESTKLVSELNLDSLMRVELVAWIEEDMGIYVEESSINPKTTVKDLEEIIKTKKPIKEQQSLNKWSRSRLILPFRFILQQIFFGFFKPFMKFKVEGKQNLENIDYPVIFMPNHISYLDSLVVAKALPWKIRKKLSFAAARDVVYQQYKTYAFILEAAFNSFPIQRGEDDNIKRGLDYIGQMLDKGYSVVLFPEGKMSETDQMLPLKKGAGLIATQMDVAIVPVKIIGTSKVVPYAKIFPRKRDSVVVKFGKPIKFKQSDSLTSVLEQIESSIKNL